MKEEELLKMIMRVLDGLEVVNAMQTNPRLMVQACIDEARKTFQQLSLPTKQLPEKQFKKVLRAFAIKALELSPLDVDVGCPDCDKTFNDWFEQAFKELTEKAK